MCIRDSLGVSRLSPMLCEAPCLFLSNVRAAITLFGWILATPDRLGDVQTRAARHLCGYRILSPRVRDRRKRLRRQVLNDVLRSVRFELVPRSQSPKRSLQRQSGNGCHLRSRQNANESKENLNDVHNRRPSCRRVGVLNHGKSDGSKNVLHGWQRLRSASVPPHCCC